MDDTCTLQPRVLVRDNCHLNLAALVSWLDVLPLIDETWKLDLFSSLLPNNIPCPRCKPVAEATIYADTREGGQWIHCPSCGFAGDILEFAGRKLQLTPVEAARHLADLGVAFSGHLVGRESLASYEHYLQRRERINNLWRQSVRNFREEECRGSIQILQAFDLDHDTARAVFWPDRMGRFVGAASRKEVLRAFYPGRKSDRRLGGVHPSFEGGWHSHVLVLPMRDVPGRLRGFIFLGVRDERLAYLVRDVFTRAGRPVNHDPGVWMFETMEQPVTPEFPDGEIFLTNDPLDALWLQSHQLRLFPHPLPLIVVPPGARPRTVWQHKRPKNVIFWSRKPTHRFFELAELLDARVVCLPMKYQEFLKRYRILSPLGWLRQAARLAKPWRQIT
jgi:hypothetical protein